MKRTAGDDSGPNDPREKIDDPSPARNPRRQRTIRAFAHPTFRLFYTGQALSVTGMWLQLTAQSWLIFRLTDSAAAVGLMTLAMQGPGLLLGPFAGALADRYDKRRILIAAQFCTFAPVAVLAGLTLAGAVVAWHVILLAFLAGLARTFEIPTRQAFLPQLVPPADLPNAIALNSAIFNGARLLGPAIAGALIPTVGEGWCFLLNAVSLLGVIATLLALRLPARPPLQRSGRSLAWEVFEGLAWVRTQTTIKALLGTLAISSIAGMPYSALLPSFAARTLGGGPGSYSTMQIAVGSGAIIGAFVLAGRAGVLGLERWVVVASCSFGVALIALSRMRSLQTALIVLAPLGLSFMIQAASTNTLLQTLTPDAMRGRVMSLHSSIFLGLSPFTAVLFGAIADRWGEPAVLAGGGLAVVAGAALLGRITLREAPRALEAAGGGERRTP